MPVSSGDQPGFAAPVLIAALRLLAGKRLSRAQLTKKLRDRGFAPEAVREAIQECERRNYLDDRTFAELYVSSALERKPIGPMRLLRDLVKQGIDGELAREVIACNQAEDESRLERAILKLETARPGERFDRMARRLVNLGFTAPAVARALRRHVSSRPVRELEELR